jgi:tetratricopeptide (TPR) repeat protein
MKMSDKKDFKSNDICDEFYADAPGLDPDLEWNEEKDYLDKDVEQKLSNIEQLFTDEGSDFYWDTLYLADELSEQGKYEEAEELYKKIAGDQDVTGDANAHYGYLLDKMGRYAEAFDCFARVLYGYADTSPSEAVAEFLCMSILNEDSPYWRWCDDTDMFLRGYLESCDCTGKKPDIEKILLNRLESEKKGCRFNAREKLVQIYGTGKYLFNDGETAVDIEGFPNMERLGDFVNDNIEHESDVDDIIDAICYDPENVDEASAKALETALVAIESEAAQTAANYVLLHLYLAGVVCSFYHECWIEIPYLKDMRKAATVLLYMDVESTINSLLDYGNEPVAELLEEAYTMDSEYPEVALQLLLIVEVDRFVELIGEISDFCANGLISLWGDEELFRERLYGDDEFEEYYLALLDFLCKHDPESGYCDITKKLLLSIYQFGTYKRDSIQMYVSEFKNVEKAEAFAKKYGMELLDEPFEYLG